MAPSPAVKPTSPHQPQRLLQDDQQRQPATTQTASSANENDAVLTESSQPQPQPGSRRTHSETDLDKEDSEAKRQRLDEDPVLQARDKRIGELDEQIAALTAERDRLAGDTQSKNQDDSAPEQQTQRWVDLPVLNIMEADLPYRYDYNTPWLEQSTHDADKYKRLLIRTIDDLAQFEANLGTVHLDGDFGNRVRVTLNTWRIMINQGFAHLCSLEASHIECRYALTYRANHPLSARCPRKDPSEWIRWLRKQAEGEELESESEVEMEEDADCDCDDITGDCESETDEAIGTESADQGEGEDDSKKNASENSTMITPDGRDENISEFNGATIADLNGHTAVAPPAAGSTSVRQAPPLPNNGNSEPISDRPQVTGGIEVRIPPPPATEGLRIVGLTDSTVESSTATSDPVAEEPSMILPDWKV
ncbi:MAG: hypothetical protein Q9207_003387 [Kuettlingeria erythrocarpa]